MCHLLRQAERDCKCGVIDFCIVTKIPIHATKIREKTKSLKYVQAYKALDDTHFEPFVIESEGELGADVT